MAVPATTLLPGACATTSCQRNDYKSYVVGWEATTSTGSEMFFDQNGCAVGQRFWTGLLNSPDGWMTAQTMSDDCSRNELICSGASGTAIGPIHREFRQGYAAPAFYQSVKCDFAQSKTVQAQNYAQDILAADTSRSSTRTSANDMGWVWGHNAEIGAKKVQAGRLAEGWRVDAPCVLKHA